MDEAREVVATLEGAFKEVRSGPRPTFPLEAHARVRAGLLLGSSADTRPTTLERRIREQDEAALGAALVGLPVSMESAQWFQALQLSPRYMGHGVREAAGELFSSPAVLLSVGSSMMLYLLAWAAPEPVFSKALAAAVTVGLLLTYTATELHHVGLMCLNLYREAEAARTREEAPPPVHRQEQHIRGHGRPLDPPVRGPLRTGGDGLGRSGEPCLSARPQGAPSRGVSPRGFQAHTGRAWKL